MVAFLGDSLIARGSWDKHLSIYEIENFGIDGDTTRGVLSRLSYILNRKPKKLFLLIGINDFSGFDSVDEVFFNYKKIVEKIRDNGIEVIVVELLYTQMHPYNKKVSIFNRLLLDYLKQNNIKSVNLNDDLSQDEYLKEIYTTDGIHLNSYAYEIFANRLKEFLD